MRWRTRRIAILAGAVALAAAGGWVFRAVDTPPQTPASDAGMVAEDATVAADDRKLPEGTDTFVVAFRAGLRNFQQGDAHAAARAFERAVQIRPHEVQARVNLGFAYVELGRPAEAASLFSRALEIAPMTPNAYYGLAEALEAQGDVEGAIGAMRTFVHLADEDDPFRRKALSALWEWEETARNRPPETDLTPPDTDGAADAPKTGVAILDMPLQTLDGTPAALGAHAGKVTVVNVWATWCGPCRVELPSLARLAGKLGNENFAVVGVSMDQKRFVAGEYLRDLGIAFESYWDPNGTLTRETLQTRAIPLTLVLSPEGEVIATHQGARDWSHPDVVAAIRQMADASAPEAERIARLREGLQ